jgi:hypothetical protein
MGNGIGILAGYAVKQQQLQCLNLRKRIQTLFQEPLFQTLSVSIMNRHIFYLAIAIYPVFR